MRIMAINTSRKRPKTLSDHCGSLPLYSGKPRKSGPKKSKFVFHTLFIINKTWFSRFGLYSYLNMISSFCSASSSYSTSYESRGVWTYDVILDVSDSSACRASLLITPRRRFSGRHLRFVRDYSIWFILPKSISYFEELSWSLSVSDLGSVSC